MRFTYYMLTLAAFSGVSALDNINPSVHTETITRTFDGSTFTRTFTFTDHPRSTLTVTQTINNGGPTPTPTFHGFHSYDPYQPYPGDPDSGNDDVVTKTVYKHNPRTVLWGRDM